MEWSRRNDRCKLVAAISFVLRVPLIKREVSPISIILNNSIVLRLLTFWREFAVAIFIYSFGNSNAWNSEYMWKFYYSALGWNTVQHFETEIQIQINDNCIAFTLCVPYKIFISSKTDKLRQETVVQIWKCRLHCITLNCRKIFSSITEIWSINCKYRANFCTSNFRSFYCLKLSTIGNNCICNINLTNFLAFQKPLRPYYIKISAHRSSRNSNGGKRIMVQEKENKGRIEKCLPEIMLLSHSRAIL